MASKSIKKATALVRPMLYENVTGSLPKVFFKLDSDLQTFCEKNMKSIWNVNADIC